MILYDCAASNAWMVTCFIVSNAKYRCGMWQDYVSQDNLFGFNRSDGENQSAKQAWCCLFCFPWNQQAVTNVESNTQCGRIALKICSMQIRTSFHGSTPWTNLVFPKFWRLFGWYAGPFCWLILGILGRIWGACEPSFAVLCYALTRFQGVPNAFDNKSPGSKW